MKGRNVKEAGLREREGEGRERGRWRMGMEEKIEMYRSAGIVGDRKRSWYKEN